MSDGLYGYIDRTGRFVIPPAFVSAGDLSGGRAEVIVRTAAGPRVGVIDRSGAFVVPPDYDGIRFIGQVHVVARHVGRSGFVNEQGKMVIAPRFDEEASFSEGLAAVRVDERWGFARSDGTLLAEPRYLEAYDFHEGMAVVRCENQRYGYLDRNGDLTMPCELGSACRVEGGVGIGFAEPSAFGLDRSSHECIWRRGAHPRVYPVSSGIGVDRLIPQELEGGGFALVSLTSKIRGPELNKPFARMSGPSSGLAVFVDGDGNTGAIDTRGRLSIPPVPIAFESFSELRAPFVVGERLFRRFGFVDEHGRVVVDARYVAVGPYSEGLAATCIAEDLDEEELRHNDGRTQRELHASCGYIDSSGRVVIPLDRLRQGLGWSTASARPFRAGLAAVRLGGPDFGFLDRTGRVVIAATHADAGEFSPDGLAPVRIHDTRVTLRPDGSPAPMESSHLSEGLDVFSSGGLAGYRHAAGEIVIPARFAGAWPFSEGLAAVAVAGCRERCIGFVDHAGSLVLPPRFDVQHDAPAPRFSEGRAAVFVGDGSASSTGAAAGSYRAIRRPGRSAKAAPPYREITDGAS